MNKTENNDNSDKPEKVGNVAFWWVEPPAINPATQGPTRSRNPRQGPPTAARGPATVRGPAPTREPRHCWRTGPTPGAKTTSARGPQVPLSSVSSRRQGPRPSPPKATSSPSEPPTVNVEVPATPANAAWGPATARGPAPRHHLQQPAEPLLTGLKGV